jgi:iron transport multicopper oxidase
VYNYVNPLRRDTVSTGLASAGDNVTIRFTTDNSGPWILHWFVNDHNFFSTSDAEDIFVQSY